MPYTGPGDDSLPDNIKDLPEDDRARWVEVWNSAYSSCIDDGGESDTCESSAFAQANGVWRISAIGEGGALLAQREDRSRIAQCNTWRNSLFDRNFSHAIRVGSAVRSRRSVAWNQARVSGLLQQGKPVISSSATRSSGRGLR